MSKNGILALAASAVLLSTGGPAIAHHSVNAQFDAQVEFTITGVLTKVDAINPHSWWHVTVPEADGTETIWALESLNPTGLIRKGLKIKSGLTLGDTYDFRISPARKDPEGSRIGFMRSITVDGKEFVVVEF
jgi:hypothetical protein